MTVELWRPVDGFPDYEVSSLGQVRSIERTRIGRDGKTYHYKSRVLRLNQCGGYPQVMMGKKTVPQFVHRLVLIAFVGPCPPGHVTCHWDGDRSNCQLDNLRWGTYVDNMQDRIRHGRNSNLNKTHCAKGHPFTAGNLMKNRAKPGARVCRECNRLQCQVTRRRQLISAES